MAQRVDNLPATQETHFKEAMWEERPHLQVVDSPFTSCRLTLNLKIYHQWVKHLGDLTQLYFLHSICLTPEFIGELVRIKKKK